MGFKTNPIYYNSPLLTKARVSNQIIFVLTQSRGFSLVKIIILAVRSKFRVTVHVFIGLLKGVIISFSLFGRDLAWQWVFMLRFFALSYFIAVFHTKYL